MCPKLFGGQDAPSRAVPHDPQGRERGSGRDRGRCCLGLWLGGFRLRLGGWRRTTLLRPAAARTPDQPLLSRAGRAFLRFTDSCEPLPRARDADRSSFPPRGHRRLPDHTPRSPFIWLADGTSSVGRRTSHLVEVGFRALRGRRRTGHSGQVIDGGGTPAVALGCTGAGWRPRRCRRRGGGRAISSRSSRVPRCGVGDAQGTLDRS